MRLDAGLRRSHVESRRAIHSVSIKQCNRRQFQPSPFCVLDEVDAPLDETNVGRLADLLHTLSRDTQFLLVTHSRRMMQAADMIYGVTMQEPGVSKIVSVRLGSQEPQRATA